MMTSLTRNDWSFPIDNNLKWSIRGGSSGLVLGPTGSGKTQLLGYAALELLKKKAKIIIIDTKRSDFFGLSRFLIKSSGIPRGVRKPNQVAMVLRQLNELQNNRYESFNQHFGWDWCRYNLRPVICIFDEITATLIEARNEDRKVWKEIINYLYSLVLKARQLGGIYLFIATQRITSEQLDKNLTDQMQTRVLMGSTAQDKISLKLAFPDADLDEIPEIIDSSPGRGLFYSDQLGMQIPLPFVAPDITGVDIVELFKVLDRRSEKNDFRKEEYWPF